MDFGGKKRPAILAWWDGIPRDLKVSAAVLLGGIAIVQVDHLVAKWIWWHWPSMALMHVTIANENGTYSVFDRQCYASKFLLAGALLAYGGIVGVGAAAAEHFMARRKGECSLRRRAWGWVSLGAGGLALVMALLTLACFDPDLSRVALKVRLFIIVFLICPIGFVTGVVGCPLRERFAAGGMILNTVEFFGVVVYTFLTPS